MVEGTRPRPAEVRAADGNALTNQAAIDAWVKDDNLAIHYLFNTCLEEQQGHLLTCDTSHAIWTSVTNQYQQNSVERRQILQQKFLNLTFNPEQGIRAHIETAKLLAKELNDAGCPTDPASVCNRILTSLPPSLSHFQTPWESTAIAERTLPNLCVRLCDEEDRVAARAAGRTPDNAALLGAGPSWGAGPPAMQTPAPGPSFRGSSNFDNSPYQQRGSRGRFRGGRRGSGNRNNRFEASNQGNPRRNGNCNYCGYYGHWAKECRFKKTADETQANTSANTAQHDRDPSANFVQLDHSTPAPASSHTLLASRLHHKPTARSTWTRAPPNTCRFNVHYLPTFAPPTQHHGG